MYICIDNLISPQTVVKTGRFPTVYGLNPEYEKYKARWFKTRRLEKFTLTAFNIGEFPRGYFWEPEYEDSEAHCLDRENW